MRQMIVQVKHANKSNATNAGSNDICRFKYYESRDSEIL